MFYKKPKQNTPPPSTILSSKWEPPAYVAVALGKTLLLHRPASLSCISIHYLSWQRWAGLKIQSCLHQAEGQAVQCVRVWAPQLWTCQAKSRVLHGPLIFFFFQNKKNIERPDGVYLPPYCKHGQWRNSWEERVSWAGGAEASPPMLAVTLAKSLRQEKHEFLHMVSRSFQAWECIHGHYFISPPKDLGRGEACWLLDFAVLEAEVVVAVVTGVLVQGSLVAGAASRLTVTGARN